MHSLPIKLLNNLSNVSTVIRATHTRSLTHSIRVIREIIAQFQMIYLFIYIFDVDGCLLQDLIHKIC